MTLAGSQGTRGLDKPLLCGRRSHSLLGPAVLVHAAALGKGRELRGRPGGRAGVLRVPVAPATWRVQAEHVLWSRGAGSARTRPPPASLRSAPQARIRSAGWHRGGPRGGAPPSFGSQIKLRLGLLLQFCSPFAG